MDATQSQWQQGIGVMEGGGSARKARPEKDEALNCPRCNSTNTKFCYYNNYSLSQPRYFCKTCRRYWTAGGSLRNVPVGGGSRKNKRSLPSKTKHDLAPPPHLDQNPSKIQFQGQDLNLTYPPTSADHFMPKFMPQYPHDQNPNNITTSSAKELFKTGIIANPRGLMSSFMSMPGSDPSTHGFNPLEGLESGGYGQQITTGARLLFPFEDSNSRGQGDSTAAGYWSGMLGGGGSW